MENEDKRKKMVGTSFEELFGFSLEEEEEDDYRDFVRAFCGTDRGDHYVLDGDDFE